MEKLTYNAIKNILEDLADRKSSRFDFEEFMSLPPTNPFYSVSQGFKSRIDKIGSIKPIAYSEDLDGSAVERIFTVYHFVDHDVYIKFMGYRSSYDGNSYEDMKEVRPVTKTVTVYE